MFGKILSYILLIVFSVLLFTLTGVYFSKYSILIPVTITMIVFILGLAYIKKYFEREQ